MLFLDTDLLPASEVRSGRNVSNKSEAALVAAITHSLVKSGLDCDDIGVISPYRQQLKLIKQQLNVEQDDQRWVNKLFQQVCKRQVATNLILTDLLQPDDIDMFVATCCNKPVTLTTYNTSVVFLVVRPL